MLAKKDINRSNLIQLLQEEDFVKVVFQKVTNGAIRTMQCTLSAETIPSNFKRAVNTVISTKESPDLLAVWDILKGEWRSFYISKVVQVQPASEISRSKEIADRIKKK